MNAAVTTTTARSTVVPAITLLVAAIALAGCGTPTPGPVRGDDLVVQVRPFEVRGQEQEAEYVGRAFAASVAMNLAQLEGLELLGTPALAGPAAEGTGRAEQPGTKGATRLMSGTLTRDGRAVRASLQLVDADRKELLWEVTLDSDAGNLSTLATRLARQAARAMEVSYPDLYDYMGDIVGGPDMSSSPLAARATEAWLGSDIQELRQVAPELVEQFPEDPAAHLLDAWALMYAWDASPTSETLAALGERLAELSRVDPSSPYDELMRGFIYRSSGEPDLARMLYSRVLARTDLTRTTRAWALRQRSLTYQIMGNAAAARDDAEKAIELDPANASSLFALSRALEATGQLDDAVSVSRQALALTPFAWRQHQRLGLVLSRVGTYDEAVLSLERACRVGENQEACANLAVTLQRGGREAEALAAAKHAESLEGSRFGPYNLACYWSLAGKKTLAIGALRRSLDLGFADVLITTDPDLELLRGDPEFEAIVDEVGERLRSRRELSLSVFPWQARVATAPSTARA